MKKLLPTLAALPALAFLGIGCSSASNQKISSPFLGWCHNEWSVVYVVVERPEDAEALTNALPAAFSTTGAGSASAERESAPGPSTTSRRRSTNLAFGTGAGLLATIDNQILVGRDMGNASSNDVSGSASIPISF